VSEAIEVIQKAWECTVLAIAMSDENNSIFVSYREGAELEVARAFAVTNWSAHVRLVEEHFA